MTARTIAEAFADAAARLTGPADVAGDLVALLSDCATLMGVESAGLLVEIADGGLALLSSTSHTTGELELYELQHGHGPCIHAVQNGAIVSASGHELIDTWGPVGRAVVDAGYVAVHAFPLRWHDHTIGALNLFATDDHELDSDRQRLGQAFANMAMAVLASTRPAAWSEVYQLIGGYLADRITIEQAKGVLAVRNGINLSHAYTHLVTTARQQSVPLSTFATHVVTSTRSDPAGSALQE